MYVSISDIKWYQRIKALSSHSIHDMSVVVLGPKSWQLGYAVVINPQVSPTLCFPGGLISLRSWDLPSLFNSEG